MKYIKSRRPIVMRLKELKKCLVYIDGYDAVLPKANIPVFIHRPLLRDSPGSYFKSGRGVSVSSHGFYFKSGWVVTEVMSGMSISSQEFAPSRDVAIIMADDKVERVKSTGNVDVHAKILQFAAEAADMAVFGYITKKSGEIVEDLSYKPERLL